jgi:hypothetical protein
MEADKVSKRWDPHLGAWVVDLPAGRVEVEIELKGQRVKTEEGWKFYPYKSPDFAKDEEVSSCQITSRGRSITQTTTDTKWQVYPWEGLDKEKWRQTFFCLVRLHSADDWHSKGLYISAEAYRDRIHRGVYAPENRPKPWNSNYMGRGALGKDHRPSDVDTYSPHGYWVGNQFFSYQTDTD